MKTVFILFDGLGDRPIKEFKGKTPLEAAKKPNLNHLAKNGITGMLYPLGVGVNAGSDAAQMEILGYSFEKDYPGRGPIECLGINMQLQENDICFRGNVATIDENETIIDRRAGRIESTKEFAQDLDGLEIDEVKFLVKPATGYRMCIVMRGAGLSDKVSTNDPKEIGKKALEVKPLENSLQAKKTAEVLNKFIKIAKEKLKANKKNLELKKQEKLQANFILIRGGGKVKKLPSFYEKFGLKATCVAGAGLYKGLGRMFGMKVIEVEGATGLPNTNVKAKIETTIEALKEFDFIFLHFKATDSFGEDGNFVEKKRFIEKVDKELKPLLKKDIVLIVTSDHSTPCALKTHSGEAVPFLMHAKGLRTDLVKEFGETTCTQGGLGFFNGKDVMKIVTTTLGIQKKTGE